MADDGSPAIRLVRCPNCRKVLQESPHIPVYRCGGCDAVLRVARSNGSRRDRRDPTIAEPSPSNSQPASPDHVDDVCEGDGTLSSDPGRELGPTGTTGELEADQTRRSPGGGEPVAGNQPRSSLSPEIGRKDSESSGTDRSNSRPASGSPRANDQPHEASYLTVDDPRQKPSPTDDETDGGDSAAADYEADVDSICPPDHPWSVVAARPLPLPPGRRGAGNGATRLVPRPQSFDRSTSGASNGFMSGGARRSDWVMYQEVRTSFQERDASEPEVVLREVDEVRVRVLRPPQHAYSRASSAEWGDQANSAVDDPRGTHRQHNPTPSFDYGCLYSWDRHYQLEGDGTPSQAEYQLQNGDRPRQAGSRRTSRDSWDYQYQIQDSGTTRLAESRLASRGGWEDQYQLRDSGTPQQAESQPPSRGGWEDQYQLPDSGTPRQAEPQPPSRGGWEDQYQLHDSGTPRQAEPPRTARRYCRPVMGGANFVLCYECGEVLQLPQELHFSARRSPGARVRCGTCSKVLAFSVCGGNHVVPFNGVRAGATTYRPRTAARGPPAASMNGTGRRQGNDQVSVAVSYEDESYSTERESPISVPTRRPPPPTLHQLMGYLSAKEMLYE